VAAGQKADEQGLKSNKDCDVSNIRRSGHTLSFHLECHGHGDMSGDGKITSSGGADNGQMVMNGNFGSDGQSHTVNMTFSGQKEGSCDSSTDGAAPAGAAAYPAGMGANPYLSPDMQQRMQQMMGASMDQQCVGMARQWDQMPQAFVGNNAFCAKQMPNYCDTVSSTINKAGSDADALTALNKDHPNWKADTQACNIDGDALAQKACDNAKSQNNWAAVAKLCPDAETIARANCTGRSYSAIMTGQYGPLCQAYSSDVKVTPSAGSTISNTGSSIMDGVNKLRGLFGH
jgi:hypothetical protein